MVNIGKDNRVSQWWKAKRGRGGSGGDDGDDGDGDSRWWREERLCAPVPVSGAEPLVKHVSAAELFLDEEDKILEIDLAAALGIGLGDHLFDLLVGESAWELLHYLGLANETVLVLVELLKDLKTSAAAREVSLFS